MKLLVNNCHVKVINCFLRVQSMKLQNWYITTCHKSSAQDINYWSVFLQQDSGRYVKALPCKYNFTTSQKSNNRIALSYICMVKLFYGLSMIHFYQNYGIISPTSVLIIQSCSCWHGVWTIVSGYFTVFWYNHLWCEILNFYNIKGLFKKTP